MMIAWKMDTWTFARGPRREIDASFTPGHLAPPLGTGGPPKALSSQAMLLDLIDGTADGVVLVDDSINKHRSLIADG